MAKNYLFSIKSLEIHQGADLFEGILGLKITVKADGRKTVREGTGGRAYGKTRGGLSVEVEVTFEGTKYFDWIENHGGLLDEIFDIVASLREGSKKAKIEILELDFRENEIPIEGDDEMKVTLKGEAIDCKINGKSMKDGDTFTALPAAA